MYYKQETHYFPKFITFSQKYFSPNLLIKPQQTVHV